MITPDRSAKTVLNCVLEERTMSIEWADGQHSVFHQIWLRDNCPCPKCRHSNGQRLTETASILPNIHAGSVKLGRDGKIAIVWTNDGHISRFSPNWLRAHCYSSEERAKRRLPRKLWDAKLMETLPEASYADVSTSDEALRSWLTVIVDHGFAILHGVPLVSGTVIQVAELFGYVRETNYGRYFDVKTVIDPINVAYTSLPLSAHTDNPYRDPVPTLQLLHCLSSSDIGGECTLVDGFRVAEELREREPNNFTLLSTVSVRFRFQDKDNELVSEAPLISLNSCGETVAMRFNNPTATPFDFDPDFIEAYYDAYRTFAHMLNSPEFQVRFKLESGDLYIVDNSRVLHGRTEFSGEGTRHLQGCYADRDGLYSRLRVLNR